jgi:anti-sigma B factor antagonist
MTTSSLTQLEMEEIDGVLTLRFRDRLLVDERAIREMGPELLRLVKERGCSRLLLDFGLVEHLCSSSIGMLLQLRTHVERAGGRIVLCSLQPEVANVFTVTGLDRHFRIYGDRKKALDSFS